MKAVTLERIKKILPSLDLIPQIEAGFVALSAKQAVVPPVGELLMDKGEVHIKYGYLKADEHYVIKIASGFYENPKIGLRSSNGLMLLFSQHTGELIRILLDEGHLTDVRTAVAGAVAAKYLAPRKVRRIGIVGTGIQARLQLSYLKRVTACRDVLVWGRGEGQLSDYRREMQGEGFAVETTQDASAILRSCNAVVTATPAIAPLLSAKDLRPGTHITAVGSDTAEKQELDPAILASADVIVADSLAQCLERGEIFKAVQSGHIRKEDVRELGGIIAGTAAGRTSEDQITVADLTGVAVQDIKIAEAVHEALGENPPE